MGSSLRKHLSAPGLIKTIYRQFFKISDPRALSHKTILLKDHLMSELAVFGLKCASLLDYNRKRFEGTTGQNLRDLYHIILLSDTYLRECLDQVDPTSGPLSQKPLPRFKGERGSKNLNT